jgi:hypothetical protein
MSEEKKGHVKVTFEVEMNKEFMDVMKDAMQNMPKMMEHMRKNNEAKE